MRLLAPQPVTDDGSVAADGAQPRQQLQRDRRRAGIGLAFGLGQCDKKNHGWREGLPLITTLRGYEFVGRPSPSRQINPNEKRLLLSDASRVVLYGLAGIKGHMDNDAPHRRETTDGIRGIRLSVNATALISGNLLAPVLP